jgi:hypothetical protein
MGGVNIFLFVTSNENKPFAFNDKSTMRVKEKFSDFSEEFCLNTVKTLTKSSAFCFKKFLSSACKNDFYTHCLHDFVPFWINALDIGKMS